MSWENPPPVVRPVRPPRRAVGFASVWEALNFRAIVAGVLGRWIEAARVEELDSSEPGHIGGLPGVVLLTSASRAARVGEQLDEARGRARATGRRLGAVAYRRPGAAPADAFVTITLDDFGAMLAEAWAPKNQKN